MSTTQTPPALPLLPFASGPPPPPATGGGPGDAVLSPIALCRVIVLPSRRVVLRYCTGRAFDAVFFSMCGLLRRVGGGPNRKPSKRGVYVCEKVVCGVGMRGCESHVHVEK